MPSFLISLEASPASVLEGEVVSVCGEVVLNDAVNLTLNVSGTIIFPEREGVISGKKRSIRTI